MLLVVFMLKPHSHNRGCRAGECPDFFERNHSIGGLHATLNGGLVCCNDIEAGGGAIGLVHLYVVHFLERGAGCTPFGRLRWNAHNVGSHLIQAARGVAGVEYFLVVGAGRPGVERHQRVARRFTQLAVAHGEEWVDIDRLN